MAHARLHIQLLEELRVFVGDCDVTRKLRRPACLLLAYLAYRQSHCARWELVEALWPEAEKPLDNLRHAHKQIHDFLPAWDTYLRRGEHLGEPWWELNTTAVSCDLWELRRATVHAQEHRSESAMVALCERHGRGLFRLSQPNTWQETLAQTLCDEHRAALLWRAEHAEAQGTEAGMAWAEALLKQAHALDLLDETVLKRRLYLLTLQERSPEARRLWHSYCKRLSLPPVAELQDYAVRLGVVPPPAELPRPTDRHVRVPAALTALVGREVERRCVRRFLQQARLVTIMGGGGIGKTRLAQELGLELAPLYANGVQFVELASLPPSTTPEALCRVVLQAFGIGSPASAGGSPLLERLARHLAPRSLLLILDNLEQLLPTATAILPELLVRCRSLSLLTTSRSPTGITGERVFRLSGLDVPTTAVQLLHERLPLCEHDTPRVLCDLAALVEGLPLALEMIAAQWPSFPTPTALLTSLQGSLMTLQHPSHALLPARQQSMEATFLWSYQLLSPEEQRLLRLSAVLPEGGILAAVAAITGTPAETVAPLLERLRLRSLFQLHPDGRFRPLEILRQLALAQCSPTERQSAEQQLVGYVQEQVLPLLTTQPATFETHRRLLETALSHALAHPLPSAAFALAEALWPLWRIRGSLTEAALFLERTVALPEPPPRLYLGWGTILYGLSRYAEAICAYHSALSAFQLREDLSGEAAVQANLGNVYKAQGRLSEARVALSGALAHFEAQGDGFRTAMAQGDLARVLLELGDGEAALALHRTSYATLRSVGEGNAVLIQGNNLAYALLQCGQTAEASTLLETLLPEAEAAQNLRAVLQPLVNQLRLTPAPALLARIDVLLEHHQLAMPPEALAFVHSLRRVGN